MKKTVLIAVLTAFGSAALFAAGDLVLNGALDMRGKSFPSFWMFRSHSNAIVTGSESGAPEGRPFLRISAPRGNGSVRQNGIRLIPGEKYRLSALLRTSGLKGKKSGVTVSPHDGYLIAGLPADSDWKRYQAEFTAGASKSGAYDIQLTVDAEGGVLDIADVSLVPLTARGKRESRTQIENMAPAIVPLAVLRRIDLRASRIDFMLLGHYDAPDAELEAVFTVGKRSGKLSFAERRARLDLGSVGIRKPGEYALGAVLRDRRNGKELLREAWKIRVVDVPETPASAQRLNNLVTVLRRGPLTAGKEFTVVNPRYGWVLFRFARRNGKAPRLELDGKPLIASTVRGDAVMRRLEPGRYRLVNRGETAEVDIRLIPDIQMFPLGSSRVAGNGVYDWSFARKYFLPALTTINCSGFTPAERKEVRDTGLIYLSNFGVLNPKKPNDSDDLLDRMNHSKDLADPVYDGMTMDEVEYWDFPAIDPYVKALRRFKAFPEKDIRSYVIGPPSPSYCNYISAALNVSGGRGRVLYEVYNREQYTEEDAVAYFNQQKQHIGAYRDIAPESLNGLSIILGNFSQAPMISLDQIPGVDFRYYLDMQMNLLANDPAAADLGGVGFWGSHNCDEETLRWCGALLRHYAIEGNTEMLSKKYGYTYHNTLLRNGDFEDGLNGWQKSGEVNVVYSKDFGNKVEKRYGSVYPLGDHFAMLTRSEGAPTELRQKLTGLVPGKKYTVYYMVANYDDLLKEINNPRRHPLTLTVRNATICRRSYFVDNRKREMIARVNSCKYVFIADAPEVELVFSNAKAKNGTRLTLNYIMVRPYFE